MDTSLLILLISGIFIIAVLYSSVGHAGASGYIAVMSLLALSPAFIKPSALALNILVASIATFQFARAGHFNWRLFWPFALPAVPVAFLGGYLQLPVEWFKLLLGVVLIYSAVRLIWQVDGKEMIAPPSNIHAGLGGIAIGFIAGLTGTGGGIFLTPLILFMGWAEPKKAAGVSAPFILLNSIAGLLGNYSSTQHLPHDIHWLLLAAGLGGLIGAYLGSRKYDSRLIKRFLAIVLLIAGLKLILA